MALFASSSAYENFMGRYSRQLAAHFAEFAGVEQGHAVADIGAGTGALTKEIVVRGGRAYAVDPSPEFVTALREQHPEVDAHEAPAERLPWAEGSFDAALAQLVVSFMHDAPAGVSEMRRVVRPGGTVALCMWDRDGMEMLSAVRRAQQALGSSQDTNAHDGRYRTREELESLFAHGFTGRKTELLEVECRYSGYDEFWSTLLGGAGPAGAWVDSLGDEQRDAARIELHRQLGEPDGAFTLRGQAWATRAQRVD